MTCAHTTRVPPSQCLNVTDVEPSKRNAAAGKDASCVAAYQPIATSDCSNVTWNPAAPRLCRGSDRTGGVYDGVCGEDGMCYHSRVGFQGTIEAYQKLKDVFVSHPAIDNFRAFDNLYNPNSVVAYAKATSVYLALMQELYFLGSASREEANMRAFATRAYEWYVAPVARLSLCAHAIPAGCRTGSTTCLSTTTLRWSP